MDSGEACRTMNSLYALTNTITMVGLLASLYGFFTASFSIFIEGIILLWIGFYLTSKAMEPEQDHS
jgi:hypothetical protein